MEIKEAEQKIHSIEQAIAKLTAIQEVQAKQTERMIDSVAKFSSMAVLIEQNTLDIKHLQEKIDNTVHELHTKENQMLATVENNRRELDKIGQSRLWKGLTTATAMLVFAFGYLYSDVKQIKSYHDKSVSHQQKVESFMNYTEKKLDEIIKLKGVRNAMVR